MKNIKLTISYDGSLFFGSQIQPNQITVQSKLAEVLEKLNINSTLDFSGRTDRDVHAFRQVVSLKIPKHWFDLKRLKDTLNSMLPNSIFVRYITFVDDSFHARFSAKKREYRYLIATKPTTVFNDKFLSYYKDIDQDKINDAIDILKGIHDFEYFSKTGSEPKSTIREIYDIKLYRFKDIYVLKFCANSYLRSQIRVMVDFIMKISSGKLTVEDLKKQLNREKKISWTLAPPNGLYLSKIIY